MPVTVKTPGFYCRVCDEPATAQVFPGGKLYCDKHTEFGKDCAKAEESPPHQQPGVDEDGYMYHPHR